MASVECPACGHPTRKAARFCGQCGAVLVRPRECPACGASSPGDQRYCDACGQELAAGEAAGTGGRELAGGRYALKRMIGESERREVHLARDTRLERDVALSVVKTAGLDEVGVGRARREARAMGRLGDHPHIVTVFDSGEEGGRPYVVSQYMASGTLADLLDRGGGRGVGVDRAVRLADELCQALEYAHRRGFIHRRLVPANVWLTREGSAKLGDFSLASARGRGDRDPRANLLALGALLYEVLTGRPPGAQPTPLSAHGLDVPGELEDLLRDLLEADPAQRPQSAAAVRERLAGLGSRAARADRDGGAANRDGGSFVGRERELRALHGALDDAAAGRSRIVMLTGDAGIGKTRLADELAADAGRRGVQVLWGRCYEGEGAPAYWPWVQVIRSFVWSSPPEIVADAMGAGAADIGQLVSDVGERIGDLPPPPAAEPDQARFRLFDAITTFLANASSVEPVAVILDDLHWADKPSLLLLDFLAREARTSRLLVVGTYRDGNLGPRHPLRQLVDDLRGDPGFERIALGGLSPADVRELVEATSGAGIDAGTTALAKFVERETEGNPFFIREVLRHLVESDVKSAATLEEIGLPDGVREVIGRRVARLSQEAVRVLTVAAVVGRAFALDVLERTVDLGTERLLEALEEALEARLIDEVADRPGRYRFAHALVRETVYEELSATRRARLHRRVGEVLEDLYAESTDRHLPELAHHFREAARSGDTGRALEYAVRAGDQAARMLAYEAAARHYGHALELAGSPEQRCDLLVAVGEARSRAGDSADARESFASAAALARELESPERLAAVALGAGGGLGGFGYTGRADEALVDLLDEALTALPEGDSGLRVRLTSRLAVELYYTAQVERRAELARQAVAMAQRLSDPDAELVAQCSRHWAMLGPDGLEERISGAWEIVRLAHDVGDREMAFRGHHFRLSTQLELGDVDAVDRAIADAASVAGTLRMPVYLWQVASFRAMRALFAGRLEEGERLGQDAFALGSRGHAEIAGVLLGAQLLFQRFLQHRMDELVEPVAALVESYPESTFRPALALCLAEAGREAEAREELVLVTRDGFRHVRRDGNWLASMATISMVVAAVGDRARAAAAADLLAPYAERWAVGTAGALCLGPIALFLAITESTAGSRKEAARHFEHAIAAAERVGGRPYVVYGRHDYGQMLLESPEPGDRRRGSELLTEALAEAEELGLARFVDRIAGRDSSAAPAS